MPDLPLTLETLTDVLQFDARTLALVSFRSKAAPAQEFIAHSSQHPVFVIGYLDRKRQYRWLDSGQAGDIRVSQDAAGTLTAIYSKIAGLDLQVTCRVKASPDERFARWNISLANHAGLEIVDIQYPFIVCSYDLHGIPGTEAILLPPHGYGSGRLIEKPGEGVQTGDAWKQKLAPDCWREWEFCSRMGDCNHYPGMQFAQFMAYYNNHAGLYLACEDNAANVKRFAALHRQPGIRLGVAHVGDWPRQGERTLEYDTLLGSFNGDWYDAAGLYRQWTSRQKWFKPLHQREDIPGWLIDSPVYITVRPQGVLDAGQVFPVQELLPLEEKCIPLLQSLSEKVNAPLSVVLMGWERGGSWVYPDSFPPVGGEEAMASFIRAVRQHGWHAGSFCNGTRWVTGQNWNGYDGREFYDDQHGDECVCREADGSAWRENWDADWRPSYACCLGADKTRQTAQDFVKHLVGWGMESIQFLDQNNGSSTFPCFSSEHGHPPVPGKWMAHSMAQFMERLHQISREMGEPGVVHSAESGLNETCLALFQETELRTFPPNYGVDTIPLYQYLFHECVILQGMMGNAPEPYHLVIRNAVNGVLGGIPGGVMTGDGTLLDKNTVNWACWEPKVENSENALKMIRAVTALRRGPGKDYLVYGRMLRPAEVGGIPTVEWTFGGRNNRIPAVFHACWQAPDGSVGVVLANWTTASQTISIRHAGLQSETAELSVHIAGRELHSSRIQAASGEMILTLPPISCALLENRLI
jgi:hypothetical protein